MRRRIAAMLAALVFVLTMAGSALAGNTGYEGQPGNQSNGGGGNGTSGYEGQPGNQSNN
jgi:hypothetical protein